MSESSEQCQTAPNCTMKFLGYNNAVPFTKDPKARWRCWQIRGPSLSVGYFGVGIRWGGLTYAPPRTASACCQDGPVGCSGGPDCLVCHSVERGPPRRAEDSLAPTLWRVGFQAAEGGGRR